MLHFDVDMSVDYQAMDCTPPAVLPKLTTYILDEDYLNGTTWQTRPAVIICPGGGYGNLSPREAEPIALRYCAAGYHTFVLNYSVYPTAWPAACCELSKAIAYVRSIADEHHIQKDKIVVCGFSAGGHLAASIGVHYDKEIVKKFSGVTGDENKPDGMILCYPVITDDLQKTHMGTYDNFVDGRSEAAPYFGLEHHVNKNTPKTFLWHTFADQCVPVENSMRFASALLEHGVPYEMHIFPRGDHGLALSNRTTAGISLEEVEPWVDLSITWLENL